MVAVLRGKAWPGTKEPIEADYLNGEIVMLGRLYGVPTPVNELLRRVADDMARDRAQPGTMRSEDLLALLG